MGHSVPRKPQAGATLRGAIYADLPQAELVVRDLTIRS